MSAALGARRHLDDDAARAAHWARQPFVLLVGLAVPDPDAADVRLPAARRLASWRRLHRSCWCRGMLALTRVRAGGDDDRDRHRRGSAGSPTASARCRWRASAVIAGRGARRPAQRGGRALAVLMACGWAIGWSWHDGRPNALAAVGLLLLLRFAMIWIGLYLGLVAGKPEAVVRGADPRLAARLSLQRVHATGDDAGLARDRRRVEPALGDGRRDPRAVRQSGLGR